MAGYFRRNEVKTLELTDEEAYMLACIMGHVRYSSKVRELLEKVDSLMDRELDCEDYQKVSFNFNFRGGETCSVEIEVG